MDDFLKIIVTPYLWKMKMQAVVFKFKVLLDIHNILH